MASAPDYLLDAALLRQLAGDVVFAAGETCFAAGRVHQLQASPDRVTGRVEGARAYRVKLWKRRGEFQHSCTCAAGEDERFCEHCVAVGLAWLAVPREGGEAAGDDGPPKTPGRGSPEATRAREKLVGHLHALTPERLIELVLEAADYDDILRRRLLIEAAGVFRAESRRGARPEKAPDLEEYSRLLREAIATADYVDYDAMPDYAQGVQEAVAPLRKLLRHGHAAAVIELAEFALVELDKVSDMLDGSDGSLNAVYDDLQRDHLEACRVASPDPEALAARLLHYELEGGLGIFNNAVKAYADVLGERGIRAWQQLLNEEWFRLPEVPAAAAGPAPRTRREPIDYRRFQLQALMERLAEADGDVATAIAIKERDLSSAHDYLSLAEYHLAHGQAEPALRRAEEGLRAFPASEDAAGLRDFLIAAYTHAGQGAAALGLIWDEFVRVGDEAAYRRLREHCRETAPDEWPEWRERALASLRERLARAADTAQRQGRSFQPDHSTLVEILLEEHRYDSAWREALAGGCRIDLWLRLAARREKKHPADALSVYQARLEPTIASGGPTAYREAIELLDKIRALLGRLGRGEDFVSYRAEIRAAHRQKRGFLKLLDAGDR